MDIRKEREIEFLESIHAIKHDHIDAGFSYGNRPIRVEFAHESNGIEMDIFRELIAYDGKRIAVDIWGLYDYPRLIDGTLNVHPRFAEKANEMFRKLSSEIRHLYRKKTWPEIRNELSEALGAQLVDAALLNKHSWLEDESIAASIIRRGLAKNFWYFFVKPSGLVSSSVWTMFPDDEEARATYWRGSDFRARAGFTLVHPVLRDFRQQAIRWFVNYPPENHTQNGVSGLPAYVSRAYEELSNTAY